MRPALYNFPRLGLNVPAERLTAEPDRDSAGNKICGEAFSLSQTSIASDDEALALANTVTYCSHFQPAPD